MYPVSGGTARFPHFAFGSVAGISFGFFSYAAGGDDRADRVLRGHAVRVVLLARPLQPDTNNVTGAGFVDDDRADGDLRRGQLPGHAHLLQGQHRHHLVEGRRPGPGHHRAAVQVPRRQLHRRRAGFMPGGIKALFGALPAAGIIFAYSGFEQADQLAGEIKNPQRNLPRAIILAVLIGIAIYFLLQLAFIGAMPAQPAPATGLRRASPTGHPVRAVRRPRGPGRRSAGWRPSCGSTPSSPRSAPA